MAARCQAIARSGSRCNSPVLPESQWCWVHCPDAAERRRAASVQGGKARSNQARAAKLLPAPLSPDELSGYLSRAFLDVLRGTLEPGVAGAACVVAKTLLAIDAASALEGRLAELESRLHGKRGA